MPLCPKCKFEWKSTQRSNPQNRYYWGIVLPLISDHIGFSIEEAHEVMKYRFLKSYKNIQTKKGVFEEVGYSRSTTELDTKDFESYMTKVREFCSISLSLWIPEPNEQLINS